MGRQQPLRRPHPWHTRPLPRCRHHHHHRRCHRRHRRRRRCRRRRLPCLLLGLRLYVPGSRLPASNATPIALGTSQPPGWLVSSSSSSFPFLLIHGLTLVICCSSMASARIVCICSGEAPRHPAITTSSASKNSVLYSSECLCVGIHNDNHLLDGKNSENSPNSTKADEHRKKRCTDRYDSSESSDSGVAVLCSSGSSEITEPGSPYSPASSNHSSSAESLTLHRNHHHHHSNFIHSRQIIDDEVDLEDDIEEEEEEEDDDDEVEEEGEEFDDDEVEGVIWGPNNCATSSSSTPKSSAATNTNNCSGGNDISDWSRTPIAECAAMAPSVTWPWDESTVAETPQKRPRLDNIHPKDKITHYFKAQMKPLQSKKLTNIISLSGPNVSQSMQLAETTASIPSTTSSSLCPSTVDTIASLPERTTVMASLPSLPPPPPPPPVVVQPIPVSTSNTTSSASSFSLYSNTQTQMTTKTTTSNTSSIFAISTDLQSSISTNTTSSGTTSTTSSSNITEPILTVPRTIRFPPKPFVNGKFSSNVTATNASATGASSRAGGIPAHERYVCRWRDCQLKLESASGLLEHLQMKHVSPQSNSEVFVCLWVGCKVFSRSSCSRSWLERHVLGHGGNKPHRCIVHGCGQSFSSQTALERHVNGHFSSSSNSSGAGNNGSGPGNGSNGHGPNSCGSTTTGIGGSGGTSSGSTRKHSDAAAHKLLRRNGKKLRYRRQLWTARKLDYFDSSIMERLQSHLITHASPLEASHSVTVHCHAIGRRIRENGQVEFLASWTPEGLLDNEWIPKESWRSTRTVPFRNISRHHNDVNGSLLHTILSSSATEEKSSADIPQHSLLNNKQYNHSLGRRPRKSTTSATRT